MLKKVMIYFLVSIMFLFPVLAECTMPYSILPPELVLESDTIVLDGYDWKVEEWENGNKITRTFTRQHWEHEEYEVDITKEHVEDIVNTFFRNVPNNQVLGEVESLTVKAEENPTKTPVSVSFTSKTCQYCNNIKVLGTVAGTVNIGEEGSDAISSLTVNWYTETGLENTEPKIRREDVIKNNPGSQPELAILPIGDTDSDGNDDFKLVWKVDDDKLIDAETGDEISQEKSKEEEEKWQKTILKIVIILIITLSVIVIGYLILVKLKVGTKIYQKKSRALEASKAKLLKEKKPKQTMDLKEFADGIRKKLR